MDKWSTNRSPYLWAELVHELLKSTLIDRCIISIIPVLLGGGVRLFKDGRSEQGLQLLSSKAYDTGLVQLRYEMAKLARNQRRIQAERTLLKQMKISFLQKSLIAFAAFGLLASCGKEREIYTFPGHYQIEAYWEATGFMDAGTVFEVYQVNEGFFKSKKLVGYAVNWEKDYLNMKPKLEIQLTSESVIVGTDTLLIQSDKYQLPQMQHN